MRSFLMKYLSLPMFKRKTKTAPVAREPLKRLFYKDLLFA